MKGKPCQLVVHKGTETEGMAELTKLKLGTVRSDETLCGHTLFHAWTFKLESDELSGDSCKAGFQELPLEMKPSKIHIVIYDKQ